MKDEEKHVYRAPMHLQIFWLAYRSFINTRRNPKQTIGRLIQTLILAIVLGVLFWDMDTDQASVQNRLGLIFMASIMVSSGEYSTVALMCMTFALIFILLTDFD